MIRGARLVVALAVAAATLTGCGGSHQLAAGESARVLDDPDVAALADDATLTALVPGGQLQLGWSVDADLVGSTVDEDDHAFTADDGAQLVAVSWDLDTTVPAGDSGAAGNAVTGSASTELVLLSGGTRTVISPESTRQLRGSAVAAVPDASDLALEITFDGVTQRVGPGPDERTVPEQAQALYDDPLVAEPDLTCTPASAKAFCFADAGWLPWVAGQGWAPAGQRWPVVRVEGRVPGGGSTDLTATLSGQAPVATQDLGSGDGVQELEIFPAAAPATAPLEVRLTSGGVTVTGSADLSPRPAKGR